MSDTHGREPIASDSSMPLIIPADERTMITIPGPARRNYVKAIKQLCTETARRSKEVLESAIFEHEAEEFTDQSGYAIQNTQQLRADYIREAGSKFAQRIVREQVNLDKAATFAADELSKREMPERTVSEISDDFLNAYEKEAAQMSTDGMRRLFGRILAEEIATPGTFSIKSVRLAAQLDNTVATAFRNLCSLACYISLPTGVIWDARACSLGSNAAANGLSTYGLSFDVLNMLQEYGLIISDFNSYMDYGQAVPVNLTARVALDYLNARYVLVSKVPTTAMPEFKVHGVALSKTGKELATAIDPIENTAYTTALRTFFDSQGYAMTRL